MSLSDRDRAGAFETLSASIVSVFSVTPYPSDRAGAFYNLFMRTPTSTTPTIVEPMRPHRDRNRAGPESRESRYHHRERTDPIVPTVKIDDVETYYEQRGSGPPLVFVHAAILDLGQWDPQVEALSEEYTTYVYDVRGHGRTGGSDRTTYSIDLFADDLRAFVEELGLETPVVCGLSTGGCIAQAYAARYPDRLSGLVLADTFTPEYLSRSEWVQRSLLLRATVPPVRLVGYERVERWLVRLQELLAGERVSGDYENVEQLRAEGPKMTTDEFAKVIRAVAAFHETEIDYAAISVPTLILYGEHEPSFVRRHVQVSEAAIRDATVREVPGAGHASNLDEPEFFTGALREFLTEVVSRGELSEADGGDGEESAGTG
jgi:pimeloyl-ACP methyl ester carboxylesterase